MASRKSSFSNRKYIYKWFVFHCYVGLPECISVSFHSVFLWDMFLLLLKIIARSFSLSPSTQKLPRLLGTEPTKHPCHSLAISRPSVAVGDTSTGQRAMGTGKAPKKKLPTFFGRDPVDIFGLQKDVYQHISKTDLFHEKWSHFLMFSPIIQGAPPRSDIFSHLLPICCPGPLGSPHKSKQALGVQPGWEDNITNALVRNTSVLVEFQQQKCAELRVGGNRSQWFYPRFWNRKRISKFQWNLNP